MHFSWDIFLDYIEIVYICTHIGIESVSGEGLQLATCMRQAQNLELHCRDAWRTVVSIEGKSGRSWWFKSKIYMLSLNTWHGLHIFNDTFQSTCRKTLRSAYRNYETNINSGPHKNNVRNHSLKNNEIFHWIFHLLASINFTEYFKT
jgi:hypothetical protein